MKEPTAKRKDDGRRDQPRPYTGHGAEYVYISFLFTSVVADIVLWKLGG